MPALLSGAAYGRFFGESLCLLFFFSLKSKVSPKIDMNEVVFIVFLRHLSF